MIIARICTGADLSILRTRLASSSRGPFFARSLRSVRRCGRLKLGPNRTGRLTKNASNAYLNTSRTRPNSLSVATAPHLRAMAARSRSKSAASVLDRVAAPQGVYDALARAVIVRE